jgi:hypothetical protein
MACSCRLRNRAAVHRRIEIQRVITARIIEAILLAIAGR